MCDAEFVCVDSFMVLEVTLFVAECLNRNKQVMVSLIKELKIVTDHEQGMALQRCHNDGCVSQLTRCLPELLCALLAAQPQSYLAY